MRDSQEQHSFPLAAFLAVALASGSLTWLCVGWFGSQRPVTAVVSVMLVELFLACLGVAVMLLTTRLSDTYLSWERSHPEQLVPPRRLWLWRPIWQPSMQWTSDVEHVHTPPVPVNHWLRIVHDEMQPVDAAPAVSESVPFRVQDSVSRSGTRSRTDGHRRAA